MPIPKEPLLTVLHTSTQKAPLALQQRRWAGLRRVFLTFQARCWLRCSQQFCFMQTDDNSVCSLTCVDSSILTKPKHCDKSISPKKIEYRAKAHLLTKAGQVPYNHFRVWLNIHDYPRRWQLWLMLQSSLACACLGKVLRGMLYFLCKKTVGNMMLSIFGGPVSHQVDGCVESKCVCSSSQSRTCDCSCFRDLPD